MKTGYLLKLLALLAVLITASVPRVPAQDASSFRPAAERGDAAAQYQMGVAYKTGAGVAPDPLIARDWFEKAAGQGHVEAYYEIGMLYLREEVSAAAVSDLSNKEMAFIWFAEASGVGLADAQYQTGLAYLNGHGVDPNVETGLSLLRMAAEQGHIDAALRLADYFDGGVTGSYNIPLAGHWYGQAANAGSAQAQYELGKLYRSNLLDISGYEGLETNDEVAFVFFKKAAEQGLPMAEYEVGAAFMVGRGIDKDHQRARQWLRRAADSGNAQAQFFLGNLHHYGWGGPQSDTDAAYWYGHAAEQGDENAQFELGNFYRDGTVFPQDIDRAKAWYLKAAENGSASAQRAYDDLITGPTRPGKTVDTDAAILLAFLFASIVSNDTGSASTPNPGGATAADDALAQCRAEASPHITRCWSEMDRCEMTGCTYKINCEKRSWCTQYGHGPYGTRGTFYCDTKRRRNFDENRDVVLRDACNGKYDR